MIPAPVPVSKTILIEDNVHSSCQPSCDVLVCGGGPAGWAAAISAARRGARVQLIELHGQLGGVWTTGLLSYILDAGDKQGALPYLLRRLESLQGSLHYDTANQVPWTKGSPFYDAEAMKLVLEETCLESGVKIRLHTRVVGTYHTKGCMTHVITESKSGREAWPASVFIDATGDGDLCQLSGCYYDVGKPGSRETQPLTLMAVLSGPPPEELEPCIYAHRGHTEEAWEALHAALVKSGAPISYSKPMLAWIRDGLFALMANHAYGFDPLNADDITQATLEKRREIHNQVNALRSLGGPWEQLRIVATASQIGVREARRIHGRYMVTAQDLVEGRSQPDAVCRVTFPVDVHSPTSQDGKGFSDEGVYSKPYDIPLRALIARDTDDLMMAGRCISGDFWAHASYRVTGNAVAMGEAAGLTAAVAALSGRSPHEIAYEELNLAEFRKGFEV